MDEWMEKTVALAQSYHTRKSCSKFGYVPPSALGGDSVTNGRADRSAESFTMYLLLKHGNKYLKIINYNYIEHFLAYKTESTENYNSKSP